MSNVVTQKYGKLKAINEGAYGVVYVTNRLNNNERVVLKALFLYYYPIKNGKDEETLLLSNDDPLKRHKLIKSSNGITITALREISILKKLSSLSPPIYLIKLLNISVGSTDYKTFEGQTLYLEFEFCEHDLSALCTKYDSPFTLSQIKAVFYQIAEGIKFLHENKIIHRDLKPDNILYNNEGYIKIIDFGLARDLSKDGLKSKTKIIGTLWYRPPEVLLRYVEYCYAVDIWAIGCIFGELLFKAPIFPGRDEASQIEIILKVLRSCTDITKSNLKCYNEDSEVKEAFERQYFTNKRVSTEFFDRLKYFGDFVIDLFLGCLKLTIKERYKIQNIIKHEYFLSRSPPLSKLLPSFPTTFKNIQE